MRLLFVYLLVNLMLPVRGQFTYVFDQRVPVEADGRTLTMPWAGGLNSAQINTMDLNGDNQSDLVLYDRSAGKLLTYLWLSNQYVFRPEYASLFPPEVSSWILLRDINCDGKKDIFTSDPFGVAVFVNVTRPGEKLKWRPFNPGFPLLTKGFSGNINIKVNESDIPGIEDVDGDGDLDLLAVRFVGIGSVEWHRNMMKENTGRCDSLMLERVTQTWGEFTECNCGSFDYGSGCKTLGGRTEHVGGKTIALYDMNNDGDRDLIFSEESCLRLYYLENKGTPTHAVMNSSSIYPSANASTIPYPAAYFEDVDNDGKKDLIATSNLAARDFVNANFERTVWLYKNTGTNELPNFSFQKQNFLQDEMIEVGDYAVPAFFDADGDEDLDLFISSYATTNFTSRIFYFENTGTVTDPAFRLVFDDYLQLSASNYYNVKIQFADVNKDGKTDLTYSATNRTNGITSLFYWPNGSASRLDLSQSSLLAIENFQIGRLENVFWNDIDQDGLLDILLGKSTGSLQYWRNTGTGENPSFRLVNGSYLGISNDFDYQNMSLTAADLDADGRDDLIIGTGKGILKIFGDFRNQNPALLPSDRIIYNSLTESYEAINLSGVIWPTTANLLNSDKPMIAVGTIMGGVVLLKNDGGKDLPEEPQIEIFPNPVAKGESLVIRPDRNLIVQFYTLLGQQISERYFIPANQQYPVPINNLSSGMYIARFSFRGKSYGKKFIVR